jgi:DNA-binding FrmR family transcriptional regulator
MSHIAKERVKLLNRMKRIRGQMETIERTLGAEEHDCADVLMLLAAVRDQQPNGRGTGGSYPAASAAGWQRAAYA